MQKGEGLEEDLRMRCRKNAFRFCNLARIINLTAN